VALQGGELGGLAPAAVRVEVDEPAAVVARRLADLDDQPGHVGRRVGPARSPAGGRRRQPGAGRQATAGADQRLPGPLAHPLQQQDLGRAAGRLAQAQAGGQHAGRVDDQHVAGPDERGQVGDAAVGRRRARAAVDQQPGRVARLDGVLGDGLLGQLVVDVGDLHGAVRR
jgi:hypothetical protein